MFDVFPSRKGPFDDTRSYFQLMLIFIKFLFKNIDFCIFTPKSRLVKKLFLNTLELYLLKRHVFRLKSYNFEHGLVTKNEFEKWPLITFFQCSNRILKQGTVLTVCCISVNSKYVISTPTKEKSITFARVYTGPLSFYTLSCHSYMYEQLKTRL